tara:strand:- start:1103 stop:1327 length:225 start_codon:yes stop_codon:yes gene_type:complete
MQIKTSHAINALGSWEYSYSNNDLSTLKFYNSGTEIARPADFPTDEVIDAKVVSLQAIADGGDFATVQAVIAAQ